MTVADTLKELGRFVDACEGRDDIESVALVGEPLRARFRLHLPMTVAEGEAGLSLAAGRIDDDGTLHLSLDAAEPVVPTGDFDVSLDVVGTEPRSDGLAVTLEASVPAAESADEAERGHASTDASEGSAEETTDDSTVSWRDRGVPPFRDPDRLKEVYNTCDTFAEMADTLEMDVTAETVRRYMIDHDIHQPNSYDTDAASDPESATEPAAGEEDTPPVALADGVGLPEGIDIESLIEAAERATTIREFKQSLGMDRQEAHELLCDLNLVDLVVGRLSTQVEREVDRSDVVERLRERSAPA